MNILEILKTVFGLIYILFLPGFVWTYVFFSKNSIDVLERFALAFALSVAIVPLTVFYLNLLKIKIGLISVLSEVMGIVLIGLIAVYAKNKFYEHKT